MSATSTGILHSDSGTAPFYSPHKCEKLVISKDESRAHVLVCQDCGEKV